jgi:hypothetical protein
MQIESSKTIAGMNISSNQIIAGMNISSNQTIANMQITSAEKLSAASNALQQQNIDLNKAALTGFTDPTTGQFVPGSLQIAQQRFGLDTASLDLQKDEISQKYSLLNAEDKRAADSFYGYDTTDPNGSFIHVIGSAELSMNTAELQKQGLTLQEAQLKGYNNPDGTHVMGNLETAAAQLGLQAKTVQAQSDEAYANISNMTADQQNKVKTLYGYTDPTTGKHIAGSLELNQIQVNGDLEIKRTQVANEVTQTQGTLSIQDRQLKIQEASSDADQYWNTAKEFSTYMQTHIDANPNDPTVISEAFKWYKAQFGISPDENSDTFKSFVKNEVAAAHDGRLTNPIDQSIYEINSSKSLSPDDKAKMIAFVKALPSDTKFVTGADGNLEVQSSSSNTWNPQFTFDSTNTNPSNPNMFNESGRVWTGSGVTQGLVNGQKITLGSNFGVQNSVQTIPQGNYTVIATTINRSGTINNRILLQSEDGKKYYPTDNANSDNKPVPMDGYSWHGTGLQGYYTKNS